MPDHSLVSHVARLQLAMLWMALISQAVGCRDKVDSHSPKHSSAEITRPTDLRLIVVDDASLAAAIEREWKAQSQGALSVTTLAGDQFRSDSSQNCDVLIFPTNWLGELVETEAIRPLPSSVLPGAVSAANYDWNDVFGLIRREEIRWGTDLFAVSFGSPQLVLVYRKDLFQQWGLAVPTTWQEYGQTLAEVAKRLDQAHAEGQLSDCFATAEPLGPGWACRLLLARSAAYARHRSQYSTLFQFSTFEPLINRPPFVRALSELAQAVEHQPPNAPDMTPMDIMQRMLDGQLVMGLTWPSAQIQSQSEPKEGATIGFADLPGAAEVYHLKADAWQPRAEKDGKHVPLLAVDGRLGALSRRTRSTIAAANFLLWLTDRQQNERISARSVHTTMFRQSQTQAARIWVSSDLSSTAQEYADVVHRSQNRPAWLTLLRVPGEDRYLDCLDQSIRMGIADGTDPQASLDAVAEQWVAVTHELGRDRQREAYLKSLGIQ